MASKSLRSSRFAVASFHRPYRSTTSILGASSVYRTGLQHWRPSYKSHQNRAQKPAKENNPPSPNDSPLITISTSTRWRSNTALNCSANPVETQSAEGVLTSDRNWRFDDVRSIRHSRLPAAELNSHPLYRAIRNDAKAIDPTIAHAPLSPLAILPASFSPTSFSSPNNICVSLFVQ